MKIFSSVVKLLWVTLLILLIRLSVEAAAPVAPGAGSILQQVQPVAPAAVPPPAARLMIEREGGGTLPSSAPFPVNAIRIVGNTLFDTATLHALVADAEGKTLALAQLSERVERITRYYHTQGYPLAQAMILAQVIRDGVLVIDVIEARYGEITLNNLSRVKVGLLQDTLSSLARAQPIEETDLNRALVLLSEIPGVVMNATLKPGDAVGTSDLLVNTTPGRALSGSVTVDSYGSPSTGKLRLSAAVNAINPLHHGDILSVNGLSSGRGANHGRLAYDFLVNGQGTRIGAAYSTLHYMLGDPFASLSAHGTAELKSLWVKIPIMRSQKVNFYGQLQYDALKLRDHIDAGAVRIDRHLNDGTASLAADARDSFLAGGMTMGSLGWKTGRVTFDDGAAASVDAVTAGTKDEFSKWNLNVSRLQRLGAKTGIYLAVAGQWANANLDSSEKMTVGGPSTVRAYDVGAVAGDSGYFATAEARQDLGVAWNTRWQAVTFLDRAQLTINRATWVSGINRATLNGGGMGLNCATAHHWSARISVAARIGSAPALVPNAAAVRAWFEVGRRF